MKTFLVLATAAALAAPLATVPQLALAQSSRNYGSDPCRAEQRRQANRGTVAGAAAGAVLGSVVAGRGDRTEGALIGGAVGAVAGHQIAKNPVKCVNYPRRISQRRDCRWVQEYYGGRTHGFEVCRGRDGVWRPSGRT
jgi:uncharacterized protein YcfJ